MRCPRHATTATRVRMAVFLCSTAPPPAIPVINPQTIFSNHLDAARHGFLEWVEPVRAQPEGAGDDRPPRSGARRAACTAVQRAARRGTDARRHRRTHAL